MDEDTSVLRGAHAFTQTSWTLIRDCQDAGAAEHEARVATLFGEYWRPVYVHIRRHWRQPNEEAKDLTQAFFMTFLEKDFVSAADAGRGRFRTFLLAALNNFLRNQARAAGARKRRPPRGWLSLDALQLERGPLELSAGDAGDPEAQFRSDWKQAVVAAAIEALRRRASTARQTALVDLFVAYDIERSDDETLTYQDLAASADLTVYQVTSGLHWARREFKAAFLREIQDQVGSEEDCRAEVRDLFGIDI